MKVQAVVIPILVALAATACESGGTSATEMERAAIDRTRQQLGLAADIPLEAKVWTGQTHEDKVTLCGTVSSPDGAARPVPPQRFAAAGDPVEFLVFEPAHEEMVTSQPDMFVSWATLCAAGQAN